MGILKNRYLRVAIAAYVGNAAAPMVTHLFDWAGLPASDGVIKDIEHYSVIGVIAGMTAVVLAAVFGAPEGTPPAAGGGA